MDVQLELSFAYHPVFPYRTCQQIGACRPARSVASGAHRDSDLLRRCSVVSNIGPQFLTRRDLLAAAAATTITMSAAPNYRILDTHVHVYKHDPRFPYWKGNSHVAKTVIIQVRHSMFPASHPEAVPAGLPGSLPRQSRKSRRARAPCRTHANRLPQPAFAPPFRPMNNQQPDASAASSPPGSGTGSLSMAHHSRNSLSMQSLS
jgi:hypothetical protein